MASNEIVKVITTDPAAHLDFGVYTNQTGHQILACIQESDSRIFFIKKK